MSRKIIPDVIVIGAMKAGTTSLYEYMAGHSQIGVSAEKELDFFVSSKNWTRGPGWYHSQFSPGYSVYAEASPNYTKRELFPGVPERIAEMIPDCKFIFLVRDPVKRAESHYRHAVLSGADVPAVADLPGSRTMQHLLETSSYATQIEPYLALFPRQNFLFLHFEDLVREPRQLLSTVAGFLGIRDEWHEAGTIAANSSETLARLPLWVFAFRETRLASLLKRLLSRPAFGLLKKLISKGAKSRQAEPFTAGLKETMAALLQEDQTRFQELLKEGGWTRSGGAKRPKTPQGEAGSQ
ncbi:sulfotransferase domain-containing protein [Leisingera sp. NJS201]|uniref:sulfotransferase domain-containing protein n=1 Tax=Leisingera sp. NJS201 TaxID=2508306 RepID=UPI0014310FDA|nr:sulfotransferase domain-containing protein [Leisingera sp. NJS201]